MLADDRDKILLADVVSSTDAVVNSAVSNRMDYHKAIRSSGRRISTRTSCCICALAKKDGLGYFTAKSVVEPMSRIMGKKYDIPAFHVISPASSVMTGAVSFFGTARRSGTLTVSRIR